MLISPLELLQRRRLGRQRAADLASLRARFAAAAPERRERSRALRLIGLKTALAAELEGVSACAGCNEEPGCASYPGGRCCGTETLTVFSPAEVHALKAAGRRVPKARASKSEPEGCAFRAPNGCTIAAADRPTRCLVYQCAELSDELRGAPRWARVQSLRAELSAAFVAATSGLKT